MFAITSAFSWQNSISLCPASFSTPKPSLSVTAGVSLLPVPCNEKDIFFGVLVLEGLVGLHRTVQLQLLQHYLKYADDTTLMTESEEELKSNASSALVYYRDIEWFALETNRDHSVVTEIASKYCISNSC